jgi:curved DNA-binding protein CbpA
MPPAAPIGDDRWLPARQMHAVGFGEAVHLEHQRAAEGEIEPPSGERKDMLGLPAIEPRPLIVARRGGAPADLARPRRSLKLRTRWPKGRRHTQDPRDGPAPQWQNLRAPKRRFATDDGLGMRERVEDAEDDPKGYYATLGLGREASAAQIKAAYRELAQRWHPDRSPGPDAAERFRRIQEAYEVLRDPLRRMAYDNEARRSAARARTQAAATAVDGEEGMGRPRGWGGRLAWALAAGSTLALVAVSGALWASVERLARLERELAAVQAQAEAEPAAGLPDAAADAADASMAALYEVGLWFEPGSAELDARLRQQLAQAIEAFGRVLEQSGGDGRWTLLVEASAPRAASESGVVVGDWELALLRAAAVIDRLVEAGMPPERLAARFDAGLLVTGAPGELGSVRLALICCSGGRPQR